MAPPADCEQWHARVVAYETACCGVTRHGKGYEMKTALVPGLRHRETYITTMDMRARQLEADVLSTPAMIALMERTSVELTTPYLESDEQTVGTHVDVRH